MQKWTKCKNILEGSQSEFTTLAYTTLVYNFYMFKGENRSRYRSKINHSQQAY